MRKRFSVTIGLALAVILVLAVSLVRANLSSGDKAPDFKLVGLNGKPVSLAQLQKGAKHVVILDFWATWCPPCRAETPHLQKLHERYAKKGLVVVGVSQDSDGAAAVKPFAKTNNLTYTQLLDPKHDAARKYKVGPIPTTYVIGRDGKIKSVHLGYMPGMEKGLEDEVKALLK